MPSENKENQLERLLRANEIIYGQLGYADVKLSFLLAANIGLIVGAAGGILECCFELDKAADPCIVSIMPFWGLCLIIGILGYVLLINIVSLVFTIQGLSPNTRTHGSREEKGKIAVPNEEIPKNQFFYGDIAKYHTDFHQGDGKTVLVLRKEYLENLEARGIDGAINDAIGQNIAVSNIILQKYFRTKYSVYFLLASIFPLWFFVGKPWE